MVGGLILAGLVAFWYLTDSWPIAAVVNGRPITRFELDQKMHAQFGQEFLDGLVTEKLIKHELARQNVQVSSDEITQRIDEIKANLGENYQLALSSQGLTEDKLREQLATRIGIEKLVEEATVSAEEIDSMIQEGEDRALVEQSIRQQKQEQSIQQLLERIRMEAQIWILQSK